MTQSIPSNPVSPSIPSSSFVPLPGSPPITPPVTDTSVGYSTEIAAGRDLTIIGFSSTVLSATDELNDTTWQVQQFNATSRTEMYQAALQEIQTLLELYKRLWDTTTLYSQVFKETNAGINSINSKITAYNSGVGSDIPEVNTLNDAINKFNAGTIDQDKLQEAIDNYNDYAEDRNADADAVNDAVQAYKDKLFKNNEDLQKLIDELEALGLSPTAIEAALNFQDTTDIVAKKLQIAPDAPSTNVPPVPTLPPPGTTTLDPLVNNMNAKAAEDGAQLASELFASSFAFMEGQLALTIQLLQNQSDYQGFIQFYFNNIPYVPASFYQPAPLPLPSGGASAGEGAGSGGALTTIIASLSNSLLESIMSQSKFTAAYTKSIQAPTPLVVNQLLYLGLSLLSRIGLQAGSPALRLLEGRRAYVDKESSPILAAIIGAKLAEEAAQVVSSGVIASAVKELLAKSYPGLDVTSLNALTEKLSSAVELFILQASVAQLGQALNIPNLLDQIFFTLPSAPKAVSSLPTSSDIAKDDALRKQVSSDAAKATNISRDIINRAIATGDFKREVVINALIAEGITEKEAEKQAINAEIITRAYTNSEIQGKGILNQAVSSNSLSQSVLANQLVSDIVKGNPAITNRELRDRLVTEFVAKKATQEDAIATATLAVTGKYPSVPEALPDILYKRGVDLVKERDKKPDEVPGIGLSPSESQAFASDLVNTVIGPNIPGSQTSLRDMMDERLSTIVKGEDAKTTQKAFDSFEAFSARSRESYVFAQDMRTNANTYVGVMYNHPQPTNFKKDVDIAV